MLKKHHIKLFKNSTPSCKMCAQTPPFLCCILREFFTTVFGPLFYLLFSQQIVPSVTHNPKRHFTDETTDRQIGHLDCIPHQSAYSCSCLIFVTTLLALRILLNFHFQFLFIRNPLSDQTHELSSNPNGSLLLLHLQP